MKKIIAICAIVLFSAITLPAQNIDFDILDKYIAKSQQEWQIPGLAIAIVQDGKIVFAKGYGYRNLTTKSKVDQNTLFAIASNSKAFTATSLAMLVDQGKINWDDRVIDYLPWFELYDPYVSNNITIRDLLSHRSGLGTFSGDLLWYKSNFSTEQVVKKAKYLKAATGFRESFGYQNIMFAAAGLILEKESGKTWGEFIQTVIFEKLKMDNSNTSVSQLALEGNVALPYFVETNKKPIELEYLSWDNCPAAAAINSSAADMAKWMIFQLNNGKINDEQLVSPQQIWEIRKMHTPTPLSFYEGQSQNAKHFNGFGMGWNIFDFYGKKVIGHGGGSDGMISKVTMIPEDKFGFVILTNSINYLPSALTNQILEMYFGKSQKDWSASYLKSFREGEREENQRIAAMEAVIAKNLPLPRNLKDYQGIYRDEAFGNVIVEIKNSKLHIRYEDAPSIYADLRHYKQDIFAVKLNEHPSLPMGTVQFFTDNNDNIESLEVNIPNPDFFFEEFRFKKIK